jgi:hypothetical protein
MTVGGQPRQDDSAVADLGERTTSDTSPFVDRDGERWYTVHDVDRMPPFLMSIVSDGDRWMFLSSSGGVTAGRRDATQALFPYETDDRLHDLGGLNGPATTIRVLDDSDEWHPMRNETGSRRRRTLYKSVIGDSVIFEERDLDSGMIFEYRWGSSDRFGFVRTATLTNGGKKPCSVELRDGLRNILPHGLDPSLYMTMSNLTNAYKRSELIDVDVKMAVYSLESLVTDRAEPAEALRATVAWSVGLDGAQLSLHPQSLRNDTSNLDLEARLVTGMSGAYFLSDDLELEPGESTTWSIVLDVGLDQADVLALQRDLRSMTDPLAEVAASVQLTTRALVEIMARADALQITADEVATAHHFSNVTYNVMRGGLPMDAYDVEVRDFVDFLGRRNRIVADRHRTLLSGLGSIVSRRNLLAHIDGTGDIDLKRLGHEYLPFSFSRRHGDPSRPWNAFSIRIRDSDGNPLRYYEGNWRDIFQNWEATAMSYPDYLPDMVSMFVDASTADGFNPYRISTDGIDWEVPDPDDPWSNIGYWGDHQIVYLLRLLEASDRYQPGAIEQLLGEARFTYADVPYRIVPYERLLADPKTTIEYDTQVQRRVADRVSSVGADGRLVWRDHGVYRVTLAEKLIVPALAKLSNYVPGGGIWMNTQRPEWNDANNALVGFGLSMVTLFQLRAYLAYLRDLVSRSTDAVVITTEVRDWLAGVTRILASGPVVPGEEATERERMELMDALGTCFSDYRGRYYDHGFSSTALVPIADIIELCNVGIVHLDSTIDGACRADGLYDSYNLVRFSDDGGSASVDSLGAMLEGQVAVLSSGVLGFDEVADVVDSLFASPLYRADQASFMLYPARSLPAFLDRNIIPRGAVDDNPLLAELRTRKDRSVILEDVTGQVRFAPDLSTRELLEARLDQLAGSDLYGDLVSTCGPATVQTYENVFGYRSYTGRSGSMYGYEGIGSIYWHMVAKLLVAIQDAAFAAIRAGASEHTLTRILDGYWRVRAGMGYTKTPEEHGAIPIDPYSHTPAHAGAQQPGMTGLVKEELLIRPAELGVTVEDGDIRFDTTFLRMSELVPDADEFRTLDTALEWVGTGLPPGSLGLTVCQVPIVVSIRDGEPLVEADLSDGTTVRAEGRSLGTALSSKIFNRTGEVSRIRATMPPRPSKALGG